MQIKENIKHQKIEQRKKDAEAKKLLECSFQPNIKRGPYEKILGQRQYHITGQQQNLESPRISQISEPK